MAETNSKNDRDAFQKIKEKSEDDFEKYITYISAGGLALSLTFVEKVVPFNSSILLWSLIVGWGFLALTLLVNLLSHFFSKKLIDRTIDDYDNKVPNLAEKVVQRNKWIDGVNIFTIITLIIGIGLIITFVSFNANNMAKQKEIEKKPLSQDYEKLGRTIPKPADSNQGGTTKKDSAEQPNKQK